MYDTVVCYTNLNRRLLPDLFQGWRVIADEKSSTMRYWIKADDGQAPHITYYRDGGDDQHEGDGRLFVEFSIPQIAQIDPRANVDQMHRDLAIERVNAYLTKRLKRTFDIRGWMCQRVDYAWNWSDVSPYIGLYLQALGGLHIGGLHKQSYPPDRGVMFKTVSTRGRWVKFYNKTKLLGDGDLRDTLRYEVSNMRDACRYMGEHWFGCDRSVDAMLQPGRAIYILHLWWQKLGLNAGAIGGDDALLMHDLRSMYGRSASTAYYVLTLHRAYGAKCVSMGLVSKNTYYTWRSRLADAHHLAYAPRPLPALPLPTLEPIAVSAADDVLANFQNGTATPTQKILWEKIAPGFGLLPTAPIVHSLIGGCPDEEAADLGRVREAAS